MKKQLILITLLASSAYGMGYIEPSVEVHFENIEPYKEVKNIIVPKKEEAIKIVKKEEAKKYTEISKQNTAKNLVDINKAIPASMMPKEEKKEAVAIVKHEEPRLVEVKEGDLKQNELPKLDSKTENKPVDKNLQVPQGLDEIIKQHVEKEEKPVIKTKENKIENLASLMIPEDKKVELNDEVTKIVFNASDIELNAEALKTLDQIVEKAQQDKEIKFRIVSFATGQKDIKDSDARKIALQRVINTRKYLIDKGIDASRLTIQAIGDPKFDNKIEIFKLI